MQWSWSISSSKGVRDPLRTHLFSLLGGAADDDDDDGDDEDDDVQVVGREEDEEEGIGVQEGRSE